MNVDIITCFKTLISDNVQQLENKTYTIHYINHMYSDNTLLKKKYQTNSHDRKNTTFYLIFLDCIWIKIPQDFFFYGKRQG